MKLFLAAPASFLPSEPTALVSQESWLHFFMNEVFAAPASALPSLPTALASQLASCAKAEPAAKVAMMAAKKIRFMGCLPKRKVTRLELGIRARSSSRPSNSRNIFHVSARDVHPAVRINSLDPTAL